MARDGYPSDLTDAEYAVLAPHLPGPRGIGRPRLRSLRELLDAVFYVVRTGCQWRALPVCSPAAILAAEETRALRGARVLVEWRCLWVDR